MCVCNRHRQTRLLNNCERHNRFLCHILLVRLNSFWSPPQLLDPPGSYPPPMLRFHTAMSRPLEMPPWRPSPWQPLCLWHQYQPLHSQWERGREREPWHSEILLCNSEGDVIWVITPAKKSMMTSGSMLTHTAACCSGSSFCSPGLGSCILSLDCWCITCISFT